MDMFVVSLVALSAVATQPASSGETSLAPALSAQRSAGGASAMATISARIISRPALIGPEHAPPQSNMIARSATVTAADGTLVPALIYDFE